jgi:hypothetical protein
MDEVQYQTVILLRRSAGSYLRRLSDKALAIIFRVTSEGDSWAMVQPAILVGAENSMLGRICSGSRLVRVFLGGFLGGGDVSV